MSYRKIDGIVVDREGRLLFYTEEPRTYHFLAIYNGCDIAVSDPVKDPPVVWNSWMGKK